jgi:hypoxanthine phosphoribosyltransferase
LSASSAVVYFLADLSRKITIDHEIDLIGASSYKGPPQPAAFVFTKNRI